MKIHTILWSEDRIEHIARHGVTPEEFDEVVFGENFVQRAKSEGVNPVYYVRGQTESGKHLIRLIIQFPDGNGYPVTARPMSDQEKRRYKQWKKP